MVYYVIRPTIHTKKNQLMSFTHLHVHSEYSLLDGLPKIDDLLDYVKECGMDSVALTDHGVLYGGVEFYKKAQKKGIKPILGSEVYMAKGKMHEKRANVDNRSYHLVLLVKNEEGYKNLVRMITKAHLEGFYYKPRIDEELLKEHSEGLVALSACIQGKIPHLILSEKKEEAKDLALYYRDLFGKENFYLELQYHPNIEEQGLVNEELKRISQETEIPLAATCDVHYLRPEDADTQDILMSIGTGSDVDDPNRLTLKGEDFSMRTPEEMKEIFKDTPQAVENTEKIKELCNFEMELGKTILPHFPLEEGVTADQKLRELCERGIEKRYPSEKREAQGITKEEIKERMEREMKVITDAQFSSYFLIVQDFVKWAKDNKIVVGPGRGSAGGSLIAYLLEITNIDPLYYGLIFERFLNPGRAKVSMPDIDLDFADRRRDEVIEYISKKYGEERVAQIITFGTMAARAAIRDVGRTLGYSYSYCDKIAKMIPFGSDLKETKENVAEFRQVYDTDENARKLIDHAEKLEGVVRHASTHACGMVIGDRPLEEIVPLQHPTQNEGEGVVTQYEMDSVEDMGLLKMDLLGLKNLTIIEDTLKRIRAIRKQELDIESIPLNDKETFKLLQEGNTVGVFQLESGGMQRNLRQLRPTNIEEVIAMVSLYRPGPMKFIPEYIERKQGKKEITYPHPKLEPILKPTYGVCVYQEQVMRIAQELAGYTLEEADTLRKAIGKKIESLLQGQKEKFVSGMAENDIEKEVAEQLWSWIEPFAQYSFNKSHAAAYAQVAYQTAYLKAHYPKEFMSALLTADQNDTERVGFLINDCRDMGIEVLPPDINESFMGFSVVPDKPQIRFGLSAIKNVGMKVVEEIVQERKEHGPFKSLDDFLTRVKSKNLNKKSMESLIKAGAFDKFKERGALLHNLDKILEYSKEKMKNENNGQAGLFDAVSVKEDLTLEDAPPLSEKEKLNWEKELLGLFVTGHPLNHLKEKLEKGGITIEKAKRQMSEARVRVGVLLSSAKKIITKSGEPMYFLQTEDLTGTIEVIVFPKTLKKNNIPLEEGKVVFISGRVSHRDETPKIICEKVEEAE